MIVQRHTTDYRIAGMWLDHLALGQVLFLLYHVWKISLLHFFSSIQICNKIFVFILTCYLSGSLRSWKELHHRYMYSPKKRKKSLSFTKFVLLFFLVNVYPLLRIFRYPVITQAPLKDHVSIWSIFILSFDFSQNWRHQDSQIHPIFHVSYACTFKCPEFKQFLRSVQVRIPGLYCVAMRHHLWFLFLSVSVPEQYSYFVFNSFCSGSPWPKCVETMQFESHSIGKISNAAQ